MSDRQQLCKEKQQQKKLNKLTEWLNKMKKKISQSWYLFYGIY